MFQTSAFSPAARKLSGMPRPRGGRYGNRRRPARRQTYKILHQREAIGMMKKSDVRTAGAPGRSRALATYLVGAKRANRGSPHLAHSRPRGFRHLQSCRPVICKTFSASPEYALSKR